MILTISTIILIIGAVLFFFTDNEEVGVTGFLMMLISVVGGFVVFGIIIPIDETKTKIDYDIAKTEYRIFVDTSKGFKTFDEMKYSNLDNSQIEVYYVEEYNSYGGKVIDRIEVEMKEK